MEHSKFHKNEGKRSHAMLKYMYTIEKKYKSECKKKKKKKKE